MKTEEREQSEKIHQDIIEIFGQHSRDEPCCTQCIQPSQETEQCVVSNQTKSSFLNEHEDDVLYVQEIPDEQSVVTIEEKEEEIFIGQSLLDEQSVVAIDKNEEEISSGQSLQFPQGIVAMEDQEEEISSGQSLLDQQCVVAIEDQEEEPYVHSDISTPVPEECNNDPDQPLDL